MCKIREEAVNQLVVLVHSDLSADVYINDIEIVYKVTPKETIASLQYVKKSQIADIQEVYFPMINPLESDSLLYCFKCGWRFGLFFDFSCSSNNEITSLNQDSYLDIALMNRSITHLHRKLLFFDVYDSIVKSEIYKKMRTDGWFPFIRLVPDSYKSLTDLYSMNEKPHEMINEVIISKFDKEIQNISNNWWNKQVFIEKKEIIQAGISAYLQMDNSGFINCINTLSPQVEGILRKAYPIEERRQTKRLSQKDLASSLSEHALKKIDINSLLLIDPFKDYLIDYFYADFDEASNELPYNRNTINHGLLNEPEYTKTHAFQLILILDQIFFLI